MWRLALLTAVSACNAVFELQTTQLVDAPGPDAPPRCPDDGSPPPFSRAFRQALEQACDRFVPSIAANTAIAACRFDSIHDFAIGPLDGPLVRIAIDPVLGSAPRRDQAVLVPEGDEVWFVETMSPDSPPELAAYRRDGARLDARRVLAIPVTGASEIGVPSRGPDRRVIIREGTELREYAEDGRLLRTITAAELGVTPLEHANLTEDARRLIFVGTGSLRNAPFHAYRPAVDAAFGPPARLIEIEGASNPYLTSDCAGLYFSGLSTVFVAQLQ